MPIAVCVHNLRCILPDQSLDADVFTPHVAGIVMALAVTNLYVQAIQHTFYYGSNVMASDPWQGTYLQQFLSDNYRGLCPQT